MDQLACTSLKTDPTIQLCLICMSHSKSIYPIQRKVERLRSMPLGKCHQQRMMMRSIDAKVPFELGICDRLHATILYLRLSNQDVVYTWGMCAMCECVLIAPFTVNGYQVLSSQELLQDMAVRVHIVMSSGVFNSYKRWISTKNRVEVSKNNQIMGLRNMVQTVLESVP